MTNKELYRATFQNMKPSQGAVQRLLAPGSMTRTDSAAGRINSKIKWVAVMLLMVMGAVGCGYAIKAHFGIMQIRTNDYQYFEELREYEQAALEHPDEKLLQVVLPGELGYGFVYVNSTFRDQSVTDDSDTVQNRKMLDVTYAVSGNMAYYEYWGQPEMHLNVGELFEYQKENVEQAESTDTNQIGDVEVYYTEHKVILVAPGYELTEKDVEQMDGASTVITSYDVTEGAQLKNVTSCYWILDDNFYELTQYDTCLSREEWYEIARVLIEAQAGS